MRYVNYGCAFKAPEKWINYDASPSLILQRLPVMGGVVKKSLYAPFPKNVRFGDIVKGLPERDRSCEGVFCSHTLEHLSLVDFRIALVNTLRMIKPGGVFRCVLPDLEQYARSYVNALASGDATASLKFIGNDTMLGTENRPRGLEGLLRSAIGNSRHLWMWDQFSLAKELKDAGFQAVRRCEIYDSNDPMFNLVEEPSRFESAIAFEARRVG